MKDDFENGLSDLNAFIKGGYGYLANNAGKVIAVITVIIAVLVTFTDVTFSAFGEKDFTTGLPVMLFSSYVIYFSLEGSGERLGESSEEFVSAKNRYNKAKGKIDAGDIGALRRFCYEYAESEAEYRRLSFLAERGLTEEEYLEYKNGRKFPTRIRRNLARAEKIKPFRLDPTLLLSGDKLLKKNELKNPEGSKIMSLFLGLIPTTLGTFFNVSVMITTKDSLTAATVLEGILKLSALPIIGFKGYSSGYYYVKESKALWIETKARLLEQFKGSISEKLEGSITA